MRFEEARAKQEVGLVLRRKAWPTSDFLILGEVERDPQTDEVCPAQWLHHCADEAGGMHVLGLTNKPVLDPEDGEAGDWEVVPQP